MFKNDLPIQSPNEDILNRELFAKKLALAISNWSASESIVIGLNGKWGSGKSSIINLVKYHLNLIEDESRPTIFDFNPWMFSDIENLTKVYFNELCLHLGTEKDSAQKKSDKELVKKIKKYSELFNLVPCVEELSSATTILLQISGIMLTSVGKFLSSNEYLSIIVFGFGIVLIAFGIVGKTLTKLGKYLESMWLNQEEKAALELKKDVCTELRNRQRKLLVIIDDIDRLTPNEIRDMFSLLKANADFPNTIYLLSFDRDVIVQSIENQHGINGSNFLEKIVQVNFDIPHVSSNKIYNYLSAEIDKIRENLPNNYKKIWDVNRWDKILNSGMKNFFLDLRNVKRYINSLEFNIGILNNNDILEVNPIDFIVLEAIRIFTPRLFVYIKEHKNYFVINDDNSLRNTEGFNEKVMNEIKGLVDNENISGINKMIYILFPSLQNTPKNAENSILECTKDLRICSPEFFDAYFTMIPGGETKMTQNEMEQILDSMSNVTLLGSYLNYYIDSPKLNSIIKRLKSYDKMFTNDIIKNLYTVLSEVSNNLANHRELKEINEIIRGSISDLFTYIFINNPNKNDNYNILNNGLHSNTELRFTLLILRHLFVLKSGHKEAVLLKDDFRKVYDQTRERMKELAKNNELLDSKDFVELMDFWNTLEKQRNIEYEEGDIKEFIDSIFNDDEKVLRFTERYVQNHSNKKKADNTYQVYEWIKIDLIECIIPIDQLRTRLLQISENTNDSQTTKNRVEKLLKLIDEKIWSHLTSVDDII